MMVATPTRTAPTTNADQVTRAHGATPVIYAEGQPLLLLRDPEARMHGGEGRSQLIVVGPSGTSGARAIGSGEDVEDLSLHLFSQVVMPWQPLNHDLTVALTGDVGVLRGPLRTSLLPLDERIAALQERHAAQVVATAEAVKARAAHDAAAAAAASAAEEAAEAEAEAAAAAERVEAQRAGGMTQQSEASGDIGALVEEKQQAEASARTKAEEAVRLRDAAAKAAEEALAKHAAATESLDFAKKATVRRATPAKRACLQRCRAARTATRTAWRTRPTVLACSRACDGDP